MGEWLAHRGGFDAGGCSAEQAPVLQALVERDALGQLGDAGAQRVGVGGAGFDAAFVMDHFYQLPGIGAPDEPMLEAYTALGALATATERIPVPRVPAMLAPWIT